MPPEDPQRPVPARDRNPVRQAFLLKPGPNRTRVALRSAVCITVPVLAGWLAGDITAGLLATIGSFTALYGANRPYLHRAGFLAILAVSFAASVALGDWAAAVPWAGVLVVCAVAVLGTFVCNALAVGPPGAYMLTLACAAGTGLSATQVPLGRIALLVLAGGAFSWVVHMAGALVGVRRPERESVAAAATATVRYIETVGSPGEAMARHDAAQALHACWQMLVSFQPARRPGPRLGALRMATLRLHALFAEVMRCAGTGQPVVPDAAEHARRIGALNDVGEQAPGLADSDRIPFGRPGRIELLRRNAVRGSATRAAAVRVGVAALIAGFLTLLLGVEHSYWAIASAVLMLHQGFDWIRTVQRGAERTFGTFLGLGLAGVVLAIAPSGIWLALTLGVLQFVVELMVISNYTLATVFITPLALTVAFGAHSLDSVARLLAARGIDTVIGCATALVVMFVATRRQRVAEVDTAVVRALESVARVAPFVAERSVNTGPARAARRDLQLNLMAMPADYDAGLGGSEQQRHRAEAIWPALVATEDLGYRVLAACWQLDLTGTAPAEPVLAAADVDAFVTVVSALAGAIAAGADPPEFDVLPVFGASELHRLCRSIVVQPAAS